MSIEDAQKQIKLKTENREEFSPTILMADDERGIREVSEEFFKLYGYKVEVFENGQLLLNRLSKEDEVIVVTDNDMPVMTGIELLQKMRSTENLKNIPVIVLSGGATAGIKSEVDKLGGVYIEKPFNFDELKNLIEKIIAEQTAIKKAVAETEKNNN